MTEQLVKMRRLVASIALPLCLVGISLGSSFSPAQAATKKPTKTTKPAKKPAKIPTTKAPKKVADSSAWRDQFCDGVVKSKTTVLNSLEQTSSAETAEQEVIAAMWVTYESFQDLRKAANLPILKSTTLALAEAQFQAILALDPNAKRPDELAVAVADAIGEPSLLFAKIDGYSETRCGFPAYLGTAGDSREAKIYGPIEDEEVNQARRADYQAFLKELPAAPPKGKYPVTYNPQ